MLIIVWFVVVDNSVCKKLYNAYCFQAIVWIMS